MIKQYNVFNKHIEIIDNKIKKSTSLINKAINYWVMFMLYVMQWKEVISNLIHLSIVKRGEEH